MTALTHLLVLLLLAVSASLAATAYVNILTQPGQLLAFWARWLYRLQTLYMTQGETNEQRPLLAFKENRYRLSEYLLKPVLTCVYCVSGQAGFWLSVYVYWSYFTIFSPVLSLLTAVISVWLGGLFQYIQQRCFPL